MLSAGGSTLLFSGIKNLQGGTSDDTYRFAAAGALAGNLSDRAATTGSTTPPGPAPSRSI